MVNGNCKEWDCIVLFFGIFFFSSIGKFFSFILYNYVDDFWLFCNEIFVYVFKGIIFEIDFKFMIGRVEVVFLGLSFFVGDIKVVVN